MRNILTKGARWLERMRHRHATTKVRYVRGTQITDLRATFGRTVFKIDAGYGVLERHESRDYLVRTQDLVLDGVGTLPQRGDQIRESGEGEILVYEVMAPGKEPHFRYADPGRRTLRIHTKQVDREPTT